MYEVEVFKFCKKGGKTIKKTMLYKDFLKLKSEDFIYRAFQIGFNTTILPT